MAKQPADAAADAIDAVRAVADVPVHAVRRDERVDELLPALLCSASGDRLREKSGVAALC